MKVIWLSHFSPLQAEAIGDQNGCPGSFCGCYFAQPPLHSTLNTLPGQPMRYFHWFSLDHVRTHLICQFHLNSFARTQRLNSFCKTLQWVIEWWSYRKIQERLKMDMDRISSIWNGATFFLCSRVAGQLDCAVLCTHSRRCLSWRLGCKRLCICLCVFVCLCICVFVIWYFGYARIAAGACRAYPDGSKDLIDVKNNSVLKILFVNCIAEMLEKIPTCILLHQLIESRNKTIFYT